MDTKRLEYFLDLVETENYSETAERMFTTQGNVSKQILALEKELDVILFDRSHRKIHLTEAGNAILPHVRQVLEAERGLLRTLQEATLAGRRTLRVHAIPSMARYHFMETMTGFRGQYPEITVRVAEVEKTVILRNLQDDRCDIAYTRLFPGEWDDFDTLVTDYDQFVTVLPAAHPLAGRSELSMEELSAESFLLLDEKTSQLSQVIKMCRTAGFEPQVSYTGVHTDAILSMVGGGMGVSILMEKSLPESGKGDWVKIPLKDTVESVLAFVRLRSKSQPAVVRLFWQFLKA